MGRAMMRNTPRTFVGSVLFSIDSPVCDHFIDAVHEEVCRLAGISRCELDTTAGTLVVTATDPVDRTDIVEILDRLGCHIRI